MTAKNILITGYPKSGNTWLCRLTAELLQCPFEGYWKTTVEETKKEGSGRISEYVCFKSHHQLHELHRKDELPWKIICIVRDPRDILLSGTYFFQRYYRKKTTPALMRQLPYHPLYLLLGGKRIVRRAMLKALTEGNKKINYWCRISWSAHVTPYLEQTGILMVKYESLLDNPEQVCSEILSFLGLLRTHEEIRNAIRQQSFETVKRKFIHAKDKLNTDFLRKGQKGEWKTRLSQQENEIMQAHCGKAMHQLGYL